MSKRPSLLAVEKNILKYRALQMILLLHQVESLKSLVVGSIRSTPSKGKTQRLPIGMKRPLTAAWAILVQEDIITEDESRDIQKIIEIRNEIGHSIHNLVLDISASKYRLHTPRDYDYDALKRFERYRIKIERGMGQKFWLQVSFREVAFEEAEKTYKEELSRLRKKIDRQFASRRRKADKQLGGI